MENKIKEIVKNNEEFLINFRRELHMHPETSMEEFRTTKRISEELTARGIEHKVIEPVGVIAEIKGGKPGKTVALRGDMDALTMDEFTDVSYKSQIPGKMHGCGHDAHTAMLLAAAVSLNEIKAELSGNVRFLFQPAEEIVEGADLLIKNGGMDNVDNVFGMHVSPSLKALTAGALAGAIYACADIIKITFKGVGGHGAYPHETVDALVMAAQFIVNVQTIVSRLMPPLEDAVVTFGKIVAGSRFNIIAQEAVLDGTVRCFSAENRDLIENTIRRYATHIAEMYNGSVEIDYNRASLPVINEERSIELAKKVITDNFGPEHLVKGEITMGAEDFSCYLEKANGCFLNLGTGNAEKDTEYVAHSSYFNIDEDALCFGCQLMCLYAWSYLVQNEF